MSRKSVLVVAHEESTEYPVAGVLRQAGYQVSSAADAAAALDQLHRNPNTDLVLLDIDLQDGINGAEPARSILEQHDIPIVFTSAHTDAECLEKVEGIPSYGFAPKQGGAAALLVTVRTALELHSARSGLTQREQELREGKKRYWAFFHHSPIAMWEEDLGKLKHSMERLAALHGGELPSYLVQHPPMVQELISQSRVTNVNKAAIDLYHARSTEEFRNRHAELFEEHSTEEKVRTLLTTLQGEHHFSKEYRHRRLDGEIIDVSVHWALSGYGTEPLRLLVSVVDLSTERKAQRAVEYRASLQRLLTVLGSSFIHLAPENIQPVVVDALGALGEFVGADRVYLFEYDYVAGIIRNTQEWCAPGVAPQITSLQSLSIAEHLDWVTAHQAGEEIWIEDVAALPDSAVKRTLQAQGVASVLSVPLLTDAGCFGFVGLDWVVQPHTYSEDERMLLAGFAQMLSSFQLREQHASAQRNAHQQLLTVLDSIPALVYVADMQDYRVLYINHTAREVFGDIVGQPCWSSIQCSADGPCSFCRNTELLDSSGNPAGVVRYEFRNTRTGRYFDCMDRAIRWSDERVVRLEIAVDIHNAVTAREELQRSKQQIDDLLQRNKVILREAHHRIKNNMAMVQALLRIQAENSNSEEVAQVLRDAAGRLSGMTALYEKLYRADQQTELELDLYLRALLSEVERGLPPSLQLTADISLCSDKFGAKMLSSLGILINELLVNSFKHAFVGRDHGSYYLHATLNEEKNALELAYGDDGQGLAPEKLGAAREASGKHFGLELIQLLAQQLGAELEVDLQNGTHYRFQIPL